MFDVKGGSSCPEVSQNRASVNTLDDILQTFRTIKKRQRTLAFLFTSKLLRYSDSSSSNTPRQTYRLSIGYLAYYYTDNSVLINPFVKAAFEKETCYTTHLQHQKSYLHPKREHHRQLINAHLDIETKYFRKQTTCSQQRLLGPNPPA